MVRKFKGWECTELAKAWRVKLKDDDDVATLIDFINDLLTKASDMNNEKQLQPYAKDIRLFLKALAKCGGKTHYDAPLWEGMAKIEDDFTLLCRAVSLLPNMWT